MTSTASQPLDKSPQDNRSYKTIVQTEREEYLLKCNQNQSTSMMVSDRIIDSQTTIYAADELNPSQLEINRKMKSKKSKRDRKEKDRKMSTSKNRDVMLLVKMKKDNKQQRKITSSGAGTINNPSDFHNWESFQKYAKSTTDRHHGTLLQSRSGSLDSISSASSQLSKVSAYSGYSSHSSPATTYRKSTSLTSGHQQSQQQSQQPQPQLRHTSQSPHDLDDESYGYYSKKRYHREARETAPPPESTRHYTGSNAQISMKMKHKRKADKRELLESSNNTTNNNYSTMNLPNKREKLSQDKANANLDIDDDSRTTHYHPHHHHHSITTSYIKGKMLKSVGTEPSKHKKHSSSSSLSSLKSSKLKSGNRLTLKRLSSSSKHANDYEQEEGEEEVEGNDISVQQQQQQHRQQQQQQQYSEENDSDDTHTKRINHDGSYHNKSIDINEKMSGKSKELSQGLLFPTGNEIKNEFNRLHLPPAPRYPGYSESSSSSDEEEDDNDVAVVGNNFLRNDHEMKVGDEDDDEDVNDDKYRELRKGDDGVDDDDVDNEDEVDSFKNKPPGKPFYFPSIQ
ncbi:unnamed protein product, partial [Schistosoma turkestanicum]